MSADKVFFFSDDLGVLSFIQQKCINHLDVKSDIKYNE